MLYAVHRSKTSNIYIYAQNIIKHKICIISPHSKQVTLPSTTWTRLPLVHDRRLWRLNLAQIPCDPLRLSRLGIGGKEWWEMYDGSCWYTMLHLDIYHIYNILNHMLTHTHTHIYIYIMCIYIYIYIYISAIPCYTTKFLPMQKFVVTSLPTELWASLLVASLAHVYTRHVHTAVTGKRTGAVSLTAKIVISFWPKSFQAARPHVHPLCHYALHAMNSNFGKAHSLQGRP